MHWVWARLHSLSRALTVLTTVLHLSSCVAYKIHQCFPQSALEQEGDQSPNVYEKAFGEYVKAEDKLISSDELAADILGQEEHHTLTQDEGMPASDGLLERPPKHDESIGQLPANQLKLGEGGEEEERHNFALAKDGAKIIGANKEAKKTSAVLDSDGDTFLKNECKADKWLIIELSQVTKVDTLVITQNELYSSRMKGFEVRGRNSHPRTEGNEYGRTLNSSQWQLLGKFNATNTKGAQAFKLRQASWLKYLQIRQLSHHGAEAVCALNDICVYGKSASEDLEDRLAQEAAAEGDPEADEALETAIDGEKSKHNMLLNDAGSLSLDIANGSLQSLAGSPTDSDDQQPAASGGEPLLVQDSSAPAETDAVPRSIAQDPRAPAPQPATDLHRQGKDVEAAFQPVGQNATAGSHANLSLEGLPKQSGPQAAAKEASSKPPGDDPLAANSAGSTASRHGGSMYDIIIQELKAMKLSQKDQVRNFTQLQRNVTAVLGRLALEIDLLGARLNRLDPPLPALLPSDSGSPVFAECESRLNCSADEILDFREPGACRADMPPPQVVKAPTEMEILQQELAGMRQAFVAAKRQTDSLLLALAFSFLGGIGVNAAMSKSGGTFMRSCLATLACIPLAIALSAWAGLI